MDEGSLLHISQTFPEFSKFASELIKSKEIFDSNFKNLLNAISDKISNNSPETNNFQINHDTKNEISEKNDLLDQKVVFMLFIPI